VASFRNTLSAMDELSRNASQIELAETEEAPSVWTTSRSPPRLAVHGDEAREAFLLLGVRAHSPWGVPAASPARTVTAMVQGRERHCGDRLCAGERIAPARGLFEEIFP
jgi:hypothetical protein